MEYIRRYVYNINIQAFYANGVVPLSDNLMDFLNSIFKDILNNISNPSSLIHNIILTIIIIFFWRWIYRFSRNMLSRFVTHMRTYTILIRILQNVLGIISILIILGIWADVKNATILIITLTAALIGFSFKNLFSNIVGWFMLLRKKYFKLYDRIEISDIVGDVIQVTPIYFKILERGNSLSSSTATGRVVNVPNHLLLDHTVFNYNKFTELNWSEVTYYLTVDSDWEAALQTVEAVLSDYLEALLQPMSDVDRMQFESKFKLLDEKLETKTYLQITEESILIIAQFPIPFDKGTSTQSDLNKEILPKLQNLPGVELSGKLVHVSMDHVEEPSSPS